MKELSVLDNGRSKTVIILGTRGIPAGHGGFETFAEALAGHLIQRGWEVVVYCQEQGKGAITQSRWQGISLIHVPVKQQGPIGTILFDFKSIVHSLRHQGTFLTLGYNTAVFNILPRLMKKKNIINMDGIEWKRQKWGPMARTWFWLNERAGCWLGNHLVADNPGIEQHLATRVNSSKITMIPYGGREVLSADEAPLLERKLKKGQYAIVVARPEPENSILEIVEAFSGSHREIKLVVLGEFTPGKNSYHRKVMESASAEVVFTGAIYDMEKLNSLRFHALFYIHGHQVGGTNPSLVEALGAGNATLAYDNIYNRWVAGSAAEYFDGTKSAADAISRLLENKALVPQMRDAARTIFRDRFQWEHILGDYENLLLETGS